MNPKGKARGMSACLQSEGLVDNYYIVISCLSFWRDCSLVSQKTLLTVQDIRYILVIVTMRDY